MSDTTALSESVLTALGDAVQQSEVFRGEVTLHTTRERVLDVLAHLKTAEHFDMLTDETCVDYHPREPRFGVLYQLYSTSRNLRVRVKLMLGGEDATLPSACSVYINANWMERELYDLFGLEFAEHPDLRRIMMPAGYEGHPLRKEIPVKVEEVAFSFNRQRIDDSKVRARE